MQAFICAYLSISINRLTLQCALKSIRCNHIRPRWEVNPRLMHTPLKMLCYVPQSIEVFMQGCLFRLLCQHGIPLASVGLPDDVKVNTSTSDVMFGTLQTISLSMLPDLNSWGISKEEREAQEYTGIKPQREKLLVQWIYFKAPCYSC